MQVDAVKGMCFTALPNTLCIHLKRFEYDYEQMTRWKIKDRYVTGPDPLSTCFDALILALQNLCCSSAVSQPYYRVWSQTLRPAFVVSA